MPAHSCELRPVSTDPNRIVPCSRARCGAAAFNRQSCEPLGAIGVVRKTNKGHGQQTNLLLRRRPHARRPVPEDISHPQSPSLRKRCRPKKAQPKQVVMLGMDKNRLGPLLGFKANLWKERAGHATPSNTSSNSAQKTLSTSLNHTSQTGNMPNRLREDPPSRFCISISTWGYPLLTRHAWHNQNAAHNSEPDRCIA